MVDDQIVIEKLKQLLLVRKEEITSSWVKQVLASWEKRAADIVRDETLKSQARILVDEMVNTLSSRINNEEWDIDTNSKMAKILDEIATSRANQGFSPKETTAFVFSLRPVVMGHLKLAYENNLEEFNLAINTMNMLIDKMGLNTFESYLAARETVLKQQSDSILELSAPAVRIWDSILLMPLVGIIDTIRARHITESLLESIAKTEALVTIVDITGVPVLDTGVAGHLMRTITAAKMLGTTVILTGMSPEGAQTLAKMGIDLSAINTRGTLRSGIAEGLAMLDKKITDK